MKQTIVEWLEEEYLKLDANFHYSVISYEEFRIKRKELFTKVKAMEKEQKEDFFNAGVRYGSGSVMANEWGEDTEEYNFEQYYNETYKR